MSVSGNADSLPPPRLFFTVSHYKEFQDQEDKAYIGYYCRLDFAYPPGSNKKDMSHVILRRWSHFVMFDQEWAKFYPPLHEQCHLPTKMSFTSVFNKIKLADKRKLILQQYIEKLLTIVCLQEFVAQFLEVDFSLFKSVDPPARRANTPPSPTSPGPEKDKSSEDTQANGVRIIQSTGYVREGPDPKGNTDKASRKAYKMKAKFEEENKELLMVLLKAKGGGGVPAIKLNLPFLSSNIAAAKAQAASPEATPTSPPSMASSSSFNSPSPIPPSSPLQTMSLSANSSNSATTAASPFAPSQTFKGASPPPIIGRTAPPPPPQKNLNIPPAFVPSQQRSSFTAANTKVGNGTTNLSLLQENNSNGPSPALPSKLKSAAPPPLTSISAASKIEAFNNSSTNPVSPSLPNRPTARPPKRDWGSFTAVAGSNLLSPTSAQAQSSSSPVPPAAAPVPPAVPAPPIPPVPGSFLNKSGGATPPPVPPLPPPAPSASAASGPPPMPPTPPMPPSLPTSKPAIPFGLKKPAIPAAGPSIPVPPVPASKPSPFGPSIHDKPAAAAATPSPAASNSFVAPAAGAPPPPPPPPSLSKPPPLPLTNGAAAAGVGAKWCSECGAKRENPVAKFCDQCGHKF